MTRPLLALTLLAVAAPAALAHGGAHHDEPPGPRNWGELATAWPFEPFVVAPLLVGGWLYARGVRRLWREAGPGRGVRRWEAAAFAGGWLTLVVALVSPLHPWGNVLFSVHMIQHELLMLVAAPLLVLGKPVVACLKALPPGRAQQLLQLTKPRWVSGPWHAVTNPFAAWLVHAAVLWVWHVPALFTAAVRNEFVHALQHLSFVLSALLFWWSLVNGPHRALGYGAGVLYLFTTAVHSGVLGALITLAATVWYPDYLDTTAAWGLTPLEDQQLGGLVMWVPACTIYIFAALALFAGWLRESDRRVRRREAEAVAGVLLLFLCGCANGTREADAARFTGGDPRRGADEVRRHGCAACHTIPGVPGDANVGPPLDRVASRVYVGGVLLNTPDNMVAWLRDPPAVDPKTAMPNVGLSDADARDVAAFLYTLR